MRRDNDGPDNTEFGSSRVFYTWNEQSNRFGPLNTIYGVSLIKRITTKFMNFLFWSFCFFDQVSLPSPHVSLIRCWFATTYSTLFSLFLFGFTGSIKSIQAKLITINKTNKRAMLSMYLIILMMTFFLITHVLRWLLGWRHWHRQSNIHIYNI